MINLKNQNLPDIATFLQDVALTPKVSRIRTKICQLLQIKVDELYQDEVALLEKYGVKDESNQLINQDGAYELIQATAHDYHKEKADLLNENININISELRDKLPLLIEALENSDMKLSGKDAVLLDLLLTQLENETEEK
jgi:hypothetical protein